MTSQSLLAQSCYHRVCSWLQGLFITTKLAHKRDFAKLACSELLVVIREGVAWWASQCRHVLANSVSPVQINPYNNPQENQSISRWKSFADRIHSTRCNSMSPVQINPCNNPEDLHQNENPFLQTTSILHHVKNHIIGPLKYMRSICYDICNI